VNRDFGRSTSAQRVCFAPHIQLDRLEVISGSESAPCGIAASYQTGSSSQAFTCTIGTSALMLCGVRLFSGTSSFKSQNGAATSGTAVASLATGNVTIAAGDLVYSAAESDNGLYQLTPSNVFSGASLLWAANYFNVSGFNVAEAYGIVSDLAPHNCSADSCGSYTISASTEQIPAYFAFNNVLPNPSSQGDAWLGNNNGNDWLCIQLPTAQAIYGYGFSCVEDIPGRCMASWTFQGSNTSCTAGLVTLDSQTSVPAEAAGEQRSYGVNDTTTAYKYYVVHATANQNSGTYTAIGELFLPQVASSSGATGVTWANYSSQTAHMAAVVADFGTATGSTQIGAFFVGP
jgi:hypothetical protein